VAILAEMTMSSALTIAPKKSEDILNNYIKSNPCTGQQLQHYINHRRGQEISCIGMLGAERELILQRKFAIVGENVDS
jgi:hypothetical protein